MSQKKIAERSPRPHFDEWLDSLQMEKWFNSPKVYKIKRKHLELLGLFEMKPSGLAVLDAGCGAGDYSIVLAQEGFTVTGVDISKVAIRKAQERASQKGLSFYPMEGDLESLSFEDNTFDVVFLGWVLHHFPSLRSACSELCRVLKPGGRIAIIEPNEVNLAMRISRFVEDIFRPVILRIGLDTPNRTVHRYKDYLREFKKGGIVNLKYSSCYTSLPPVQNFSSSAKNIMLKLILNLRAFLFNLNARILPRPLNGQDLLITGVKKGEDVSY